MNTETLAMRLALDLNDGSANLVTITGPMCAGKTDVLVRIAQQLKEKVKALRHVFDAKRTPTWRSRNGQGFAADVYDETSLEQYEKEPKVLLIDEIHFIEHPEILTSILHRRRNQGFRTVLSGLNMDYQGIEFDTTARVLALSDEIFVLTARCEDCKKPAKYTHRTTRSESRITVGFDQYRPLCLDCWLEARRRLESPCSHL